MPAGPRQRERELGPPIGDRATLAVPHDGLRRGGRRVDADDIGHAANLRHPQLRAGTRPSSTPPDRRGRRCDCRHRVRRRALSTTSSTPPRRPAVPTSSGVERVVTLPAESTCTLDARPNSSARRSASPPRTLWGPEAAWRGGGGGGREQNAPPAPPAR